MRAFHGLPIVALCLACVLPVSGAQAQSSSDGFGVLFKKPQAPPPPVKAKPPPWPLLQTGATLCRTADDLTRIAARQAGNTGAGAADCRVITRPTPITILHREGPGRTEVHLTGQGADATGWTNVWLPHNPPR